MLRPGVYFSLLLLLVLVCPACQKNQLGGPTYSVNVSPPAAAVPQGSTQTFTASVQSNGGNISANPSWSLSSTTLGTISPTTGNVVSYVQGSALGKWGTISASYNGVTGSAQIFNGGSLPSSGSYGIIDVSPQATIFGGTAANSVNFYTSQSSPPITTYTDTTLGDYTVGTQSVEAVGQNGGWFSIAWSIAQNFSSYSFLKFDIRMNGGDVKVKIDTGGAQEQLADLNAPSTGNPPLSIPAVPEDNQFHSVSIPLASFTTSSGSTISDIVFQLSTGNPTETIYVDNVRFE